MWMSRTVSHMSMNEIDTPPYWITRKQQAIASAASSYASPATADPRAPPPPPPPPPPTAYRCEDWHVRAKQHDMQQCPARVAQLG